MPKSDAGRKLFFGERTRPAPHRRGGLRLQLGWSKNKPARP